MLEIIPVTKPYKQVSREWRDSDTVVELHNGVRFGGEEINIIAGPCAVEGAQDILDIAHQLKEAGATVLRGGAFKPRTSPYSWQGLGEEGLKMLARAKEATGMAIVTEALDPEGVDLVAQYADIIQIGARNMQNYTCAASGWPIQHAGAAQAGDVRHHRRVAPRGRVYPGRRKRTGDPV